MPTKVVTKSGNPKVYRKAQKYNRRNTRYAKKKASNLATYRRGKMKFQSKRRPFVEIKSRSHYDLWVTFGGSSTFPNVDTITNPQTGEYMIDGSGNPLRTKVFPIWSYMNPVQGVTEKDMLGTTLTAKYLTAKVQFRFPQIIQTVNPKYYIIHGWVKVPPNLTQFTTPTRSGFTRSQMLQHIINHVNRDFDQDGDDEFLQFKEATNKDYIVVGKKLIRPNQNKLQVQPTIVSGTTPDTLGRLPEQHIVCKWPMNNRKIKYVKGTDSTMTSSAPFFYDNKGWVPFLLYYCPNVGQLALTPGTGDQKSPQISWNDKFWFSDS